MAKLVYDPGHKRVLDDMLLDIPGVKPGRMFGLPGYYVGGKLFACLYEKGVAVKLPEGERERLLREEGVETFVPMGKHAMKEWVLINRKDSRDYLELEDAFIASVEYVLSLRKGGGKKR